MKNEIFVFISSDSVKICSQNRKSEVNFKQKGIRNVSPAIIAILIREALDEQEIVENEIVIIPGPEYIVSYEKITSHIKKTTNQEFSSEEIAMKVLKTKYDNGDYTFALSSKFIFNGRLVGSYEAIPLLQKYFLNRQSCSFEVGFMNALISNLEKNEIKVKSIVPQSHFDIDKKEDRQIRFYFTQNQTFACVTEFGRIIKNVSADLGLKRIMSDVSTTFDLSMTTAEKLINMYGFVFLPKEYLNYVIDIPVYGNVVQSVCLSDLSFCIRESLKGLYNGILNNLSAKMRDYDISSEFICETAVNLRGMDTLLELILNTNVEFRTFEHYDNVKMSETYNKLVEIDNLKPVKIVEKEIVEEPEVAVQSPLIDRITNIFNMKIKPFLLEPDV